METYRELEMTDYLEWYEWLAIRNLYLTVFMKEVREHLNDEYFALIRQEWRRLFGPEQRQG